MHYPSLMGRRVLITGGSRGLGRAMALGLMAAGARVAIVSTGPSAPLEETRRQAQSLNAKTPLTCLFGDLRKTADCERVCKEATAAIGPIDVLVNNAAIPMSGPGEPFWKMPTEDWFAMAHMNCDSPFLMSRCVVPGMIERRIGKIVNVSTSGRTMVRDRFSPYGPSKAFVEACTRVWARELEGTGVTMNVLAPGGVVDTSADVTGVAREGKGFQPASVMAPPILWLAADESNGHTGQRFIANLWNEDLELEARVRAARQDGAETPAIL